MNKYLLFGGDVYYPRGGFDDYQGEFDSLEEAESYAKEKFPDTPRFEWWHIVHDDIIVKDHRGI